MVCCKQTWFIPLIVDLSSLLSEIIYMLSKICEILSVLRGEANPRHSIPRDISDERVTILTVLVLVTIKW